MSAVQVSVCGQTDRSGRIELDEFRQLVTDLRNFHAMSGDETERIFRHFDTDRSSAIERNELNAALYALGLSVDSDEGAQIFRKYATDLTFA